MSDHQMRRGPDARDAEAAQQPDKHRGEESNTPATHSASAELRFQLATKAALISKAIQAGERAERACTEDDGDLRVALVHSRVELEAIARRLRNIELWVRPRAGRAG